MTQRFSWLPTRLIATALIALALFGAASVAQTGAAKERFSAVAIDLDRGNSIPIRIAIDRWSSDAERDQLMAVMLSKGPDALLEALRDMPPVGSIRTLTSLAWDLRFARRAPLPGGAERIILATDRPLSFGEVWNLARTMEYPFTIIELRVPKTGEGDGAMSIATKIIPDEDDKLVILENYGTQRIKLTQVRREKPND